MRSVAFMLIKWHKPQTLYPTATIVTQKMKNVTYIIPDLAPATGGPVTATRALANAQVTLGLNISIVATDWGLNEPVPCVDGVEVRLFPCRYAKWRWAPSLGRYLRKHLLNSDIVMLVEAKVVENSGKLRGVGHGNIVVELSGIRSQEDL